VDGTASGQCPLSGTVEHSDCIVRQLRNYIMNCVCCGFSCWLVLTTDINTENWFGDLM
jgi:hypothetical protein